MAKFTPNGLECYLQDIEEGTGETPVDISAFTAAAPVVLTVATDLSTTSPIGSLVTVSGTGSPLDGQTYPVEAITATSITLQGSDLTGYPGVLINVGEVTPIDPATMLRFCLSSYEREIAAADAIDVSTFCGPESLAGTPQPGTISIEGFIDYQVDAYNEWREAISDGLRRVFRVVLPPTVGGEIIMTITPSGLTETYAVNEAASFSGEAVINSEPVYIIPT